MHRKAFDPALLRLWIIWGVRMMVEGLGVVVVRKCVARANRVSLLFFLQCFHLGRLPVLPAFVALVLVQCSLLVFLNLKTTSHRVYMVGVLFLD